jgi:AAA15 family ATPase/GTPase
MNTKRIKKTSHPRLFQTNSRPYDLAYAKWTEKWWQWAFSIPKDNNPIVDKTGENCGKGQEGPVWYLAGTTKNSSHAKRNCVIPHQKSILFPIIVSLFSRSEKPTMTDEELVRHTAKDIDQTSFLEVKIDDFNFTDLSKFRVQSFFNLDLIEGNIWDLKSGCTMAASDGFWVFIKSLNMGNHTIHFHGVEPNFNTRLVYNITII